ncbi:MAG: DUF6812 domain-containing protein [Candidatus Binatia bacterium]
MATKLVGKTVDVDIWTDGHRIQGKIFIPTQDKPYQSRLSDYLNDAERAFIPVTRVRLSTLNGNEVLWEGGFLAVNKNSIKMVRVVEE